MKIVHRVSQQHTSDGDGVKIKRIAGFNDTQLDPILMIDELRSDNPDDFIGGFPPHPHRGMETFTYIKKGGFEHRDHLGNREAIRANGTQWMSTGKGVLHSEMPLNDAKDGMHGFQIWINMPAKNKMRDPIYQDSNEKGNPVLQNDAGATLRALSGEWSWQDQKIAAAVTGMSANTRIADIYLPKGKTINLGSFDEAQLGLFIYQGKLADGQSNGHEILMLKPDGELVIQAHDDHNVEALLFATNPIGEPVVHYGPFVMNTEQEIHQAINDYQRGLFGEIRG